MDSDSRSEPVSELQDHRVDIQRNRKQPLQATFDPRSSHSLGRKRSRSPLSDTEEDFYRIGRKSVKLCDANQPKNDAVAFRFSILPAVQGNLQRDALGQGKGPTEVGADNDGVVDDSNQENDGMDQQEAGEVLPDTHRKSGLNKTESNCRISSVETYQTSTEDGSQNDQPQNHSKLPNAEVNVDRASRSLLPTIVVDDCSSSDELQSCLTGSVSVSPQNSIIESDDSNSVGSSNLADSSDEDEFFTVEAREKMLEDRYHQCLDSIKGLSLLPSQSPQESNITPIISNLSSILEETTMLERDDSTFNEDRMKNLSYAVLKNLSSLSELIGDTSGALDHLLSAAKYYYKDVAMIHQMGELAVKLENYPFAASLFQDALSIRNNHWPSLDAIITLLYAMNHIQTCLSYCLMALKMVPSHVRTLTFTRKILDDHQIRSDWVNALEDASPYVAKSNPASVKNYIDEAEIVREKWTKPGLNREKPPQLEMPSLENMTLEELSKALINCLVVADDTKKWSSPLCVTLPELPNSQPSSETGTDDFPAAKGSGTGSSIGAGGKVTVIVIDSDSDSQNSDGNKATQVSQPAKSLSQKVDSVRLGQPENREAVRNNKSGTKNEEEAIRKMLNRFLSNIFTDRVQTGTGSQGTRLFSSGAHPGSVSSLSPKPLFKEDCPGAESLVVMSLMSDMNGKVVLAAVRMVLQFLAEKWDTYWPTSLVQFYRTCFSKVCNFEQLPLHLSFRPGTENRVRRAIYFTLMGAELLVDEWMTTGEVKNPPEKFNAQMDFLSAWPFSNELKDPEDRPLHLRILFLMYKWHSLKGETEEMQSYSSELSARLEPTEKMSMPNLVHKNVISKDLLESWLFGKLISGQHDDLKKYVVGEQFEEAIKLGEKLFFEVTHDKTLASLPLSSIRIASLLRAVELQDDVDTYSKWSQKLLQHAFSRWNYVNTKEPGDNGKKVVEARCTLLEIVDVAVKFYENHKFSCQMDLETLWKWASAVADVCVISVHTVDGNVRKPLTIAPWTLLYWILVKRESELSGDSCCSLNYLKEVHSYLGKHEWCAIGNGAFLIPALARFLDECELRKHQDGIKCGQVSLKDFQLNIKQCLYCLYGSKPLNSVLKKHNCKEVDLTLPGAACLYSHLEPSSLPGIYSPKNDSIRQEFVPIFNKILKLESNVSFALSYQQALSYIRSFDPFSEMLEFPETQSPMNLNEPASKIFHSFYYLLADYHLKNGDNEQASKLYMSDLRINLPRFDSWAGLALSRSALVESKFRSFALKPSKELMDEAKEAVQCYAIALKLRPDCEQLCVECGVFIYTVQTYVSRQIKQAVQHAVPEEELAELRNHRDALLLLLQKYLTKAEQASERKEPWLPQYLMGKALEKLERDKPQKYLARYTAAADCLHESGARYPARIAYYKPPVLALEALEIHYRIFASSLKFLTKDNSTLENEEMNEALAAVDFYMRKAENGNFASMLLEMDESEDELVWDGTMFVSGKAVPDKLDGSAIPRRDLAVWKADLIERSIKGLHLCLRRYPEHYKSIYRLARYYYEATSVENHLAIARDLLFGSSRNWQKVPHMPCPGLFSQRTSTMFFNGIWHFLSENVQRPLSFTSHMYRSVLLAISVLYDLCDNSLLRLISQQLMNPPTSDAKRFLKLNDYAYLANMALRYVLLLMVNRINDYEGAVSKDQQVVFLSEVFTLWITIKKEQHMSGENRRLCDVMLVHAYLRLIEGIHRDQCSPDDVDVSPEIISRAVKYIQQAQAKMNQVPNQ